MRYSYLIYLAEMGAVNIHPMGRRASACLVAALDPQPGMHVLDVGCGTGETMARLVLEKDVYVDGMDVLPSMLHIARRRFQITGVVSRTQLALASGTALPCAAGRYDGVYTESVLGFQEARTARKMLREIRRVLKPGGRYVANEAIWKSGTDPAIVAAIHATGVADFGLSQASPQPWAVDAWTQEMEAAGLHLDAADLLSDRVQALEPRERFRSWRLRLSDLLTVVYRFRGLVVPRLRLQKRQYRRLLAHHRQDGRYLESRLFVLTAT